MDLEIWNGWSWIWKSTSELPVEIWRELMKIQEECFVCFWNLIKQWNIAERVFSEKEIRVMISEYLEEHSREIKDFLWSKGKVLIAMDSAEQFADSTLDQLWVENEVHKIKISTYSETISHGKDIDEHTKETIRQSMNLSEWDSVLILEDMIDTGNTLDRLTQFFDSLWVKVKILCLFDKEIDQNGETFQEKEKTRIIKEKLGKRLQSIKSIGNEFIIWSGIDYSHRLLAEVLWLFKIQPQHIGFFINQMHPFIDRIDDILPGE